MNTSVKIITSAFFIALMLLLSPRNARASEGTAEITSTVGEDLRCFATSVFLRNRDYKILVTCRDLVYPPSPDKTLYVIWVTPLDGGKSVRLGTLQFGKIEYTTRKPFSEFIVTSEITDRPRTPSENIVARGLVKTIDLLETGEPAATPTSSGPAEDFGEILEQPTPIPSPTVQESTGFFSKIRRGGIILAAGVFAVLIILAFLTRSRG